MQNHRRPTARLRRRRSLVAAIGALEALESRQFLSTTPFVLSSGTLSQNWEAPNDTKLATDDWSQIPSFVGYRGDDVVTSTNADLHTATGDGTLTVDVNVNQSASATAGGVSEVALTAPIGSGTTAAGTPGTTGLNTIALQGSGTADAPNLVAYLDTTGVSAVRVKFDVIDIDAENLLAQPFILQYRVGDTGSWTNIDETYRADAGAPGAGTGNTNGFNLLLPAAAANQPLVEVRWITDNITGNDQFIAIDNIEISATTDTNPGVFAVDDASATIGVNETGAPTATVTITRSGGSAGAVTLPYTFGGTATPGTDFTLPNGATATGGTISFAAGQTTATISLPIIDDAVAEGNETIVVTLGTPSAGTLNTAKASSTVTITDNDGSGTLNFEPVAYSVGESGTTVTLTVTRTNGSAGTASVNYTLINGTAINGSDFSGTNGTVTFADGETSKTFTVTILNDSVTEQDETFTVALSSPSSGVNLGTATTATVTIVDDDGVVPTGLVINEVDINPPGTNAPWQFIELRGTPGQILRDVYILQIEGDNVNGVGGQVDSVINLTNAQIGSNGLLLVRASGGFTAEDPATGVFDVPQLSGSGSGNNGIETGSVSLILFYRDSHNGEIPAVPAYGDDLDTDNTGTNSVGTLEGFSPLWTELDAVGLLDGNSAADLVYGGGPIIPSFASGNAADYVARLQDNTTPYDAAAWYYADLTNGDNGETFQTKKLSTSPTLRSANTPTDAKVTPGGYLTPLVTTTNVVSATISLGSGPQSLVVVFDQSVASSVNASAFTLTNTTTGNPVTLNVANVSADGKTVTLTFSGVTGSVASTILANGNYSLTVSKSVISSLPSDYTTTSLFFLNADFDRDRTVGFSDLLALAKNYNGTGKTFAQGDTDYDGDVDFNDLLTLAKSYNVTLTAPAAVLAMTAPAPTRTRTSFGASIIA